LVIHEGHRFGFPFGETDQKDHDIVDKNGLDDDEIPAGIEEYSYLESLFEREELLDGRCIRNVF